MTIKEKLDGFYHACQFELRQLPKYPKVLEARKAGLGGTSEVTILWAEEEVSEAPDHSLESKTISKLGELQKQYPRATYWFICHTTEGLSQEFRRFAKRLGFNVREQALFFDAGFRSDVNPSATDVTKELRLLAISGEHTRVPQPLNC